MQLCNWFDFIVRCHVCRSVHKYCVVHIYWINLSSILIWYRVILTFNSTFDDITELGCDCARNVNEQPAVFLDVTTCSFVYMCMCFRVGMSWADKMVHCIWKSALGRGNKQSNESPWPWPSVCLSLQTEVPYYFHGWSPERLHDSQLQ